MIKPPVLFAAVGLLMASSLYAELVWENPSIALKARSGDSSASAIFRFFNRSQHVVRIIRVNPSCGCTVAKITQDVVAPGASGELPANIALSPSEKTRSVSIKVSTDEGPDAYYHLLLHVDRVEPVQMHPHLLYWKVGEAPTTKRITIKVEDGVTVVGVEILGDGFSAELGSRSDPELSVFVTPTQVEGKRMARLRLATEENGHKIPVSQAYLRVIE